MADVHDCATRSYNMSQIKGKNTKPEILVRKFLFARGLRYKLHDNSLPGTPDLILPKFSTVIFINGCFWHGHQGCKYFSIPKTRKEWWENKIEYNQKKDTQNHSALLGLGWRVITIWECDLKTHKREKTLLNLINKFKSNKWQIN